MIRISLTRDEARMIDDAWMPYMLMSAKSALRSNAGVDQKYLTCKIVLSLLEDVELAFKKKLLNRTNKLSFTLSDAHGSAFYVYLMKRPIDHTQIWAINFRQKLCNQMHRQLFADMPPVSEGVAVTMVDYELGD